MHNNIHNNTLRTACYMLGGLIVIAIAIILFIVCCPNASAATLSTLNGWDRQLMVLLNFDGGTAMDYFMFNISQKIIFVPVCFGVIVSLIMEKLKWNSILLFVVIIALTVTLCDQTSSGLMKPLVARLRPSHDPMLEHLLHYVNGYTGGRFGFMSSHAANTVGVATLLTMFSKDKCVRIVFWMFCLIICYSRIYLGVHYPGDIICGGIIGSIIAYFIGGLYRRYLSNIQIRIHAATMHYTMGAVAAILIILNVCGVFLTKGLIP